MWVDTADKVFKVRGQKSRLRRDQMHFPVDAGVHFGDVESSLTCFFDVAWQTKLFIYLFICDRTFKQLHITVAACLKSKFTSFIFVITLPTVSQFK